MYLYLHNTPRTLSDKIVAIFNQNRFGYHCYHYIKNTAFIQFQHHPFAMHNISKEIIILFMIQKYLHIKYAKYIITIFVIF